MKSNNQSPKVAPASMSLLLPLFGNPLPAKIPYWEASAGDTLIANLFIAGSFDPEVSWANGVLLHSFYFMFHVTPALGSNKLTWKPGDKVRITIKTRDSALKIASFTDYTGTPERCAARMQKWLKTVAVYLAA